MTKKQLLNELDNVSGLRENRMRVANLVLQNTTCLPKLLDISFDMANKMSVKAIWILEFIAKTNITLIFPFVDFLSKNMQLITKDSAVRSLAKILQLLVEENKNSEFLTVKQKDRFIEIAFDWMISTHKVAIKAYSMRSLFYLGKNSDWVHDELSTIIKENMHNESAAYKSRGRITLEQINKLANQ